MCNAGTGIAPQRVGAWQSPPRGWLRRYGAAVPPGASRRGVITPAGVWPAMKAGYRCCLPATAVQSCPPASPSRYCPTPVPGGPRGAAALLTFKPARGFGVEGGSRCLLSLWHVCPPPAFFPFLGTGWWHLPGTLLLGTAPWHVRGHRRRQPRSRHRRQPGGGGTGPTLPPSLAAGCISPSLSLAPPTRLLLLIFNFISQTPCLIKRRHLSLRADVGYLLLQTSVGRMLPRRNTPPTGYFTGIKRGADTPTPPPPSPPQGALRGKDAVFLHHRAFSFPSSFNNNALKMFDICNKQLASCYGRMSFYFRAG